MHAAQTFSLLALAGSALAAPQWGNWGNWKGGNREGATQTDVAVVTAYTTVTYGGNWGRPTATATPVANETPVATSAASTWSEWSSAPAATPTGSSNSGYMGTVDTWRSKMGLSQLSQDSTLEGNALKTAQDGNGQMVHELNPGSMAQVLAPGSADEFEKVFVGGWLCELPNTPGLDGICSSMSAGWSYEGQTGHAEILTSGSYSKIGCANAGGIWSCDLA